jgi:hypothetical protein
MASTPRVERILIEALAKHLPPSASELHLVDVGGKTGAILMEMRPDIHIMARPAADENWAMEPDTVDAVVAFDQDLTPELLTHAQQVLRVGGRLIVMATTGDPNPAQVQTLESAGYTRILVEVGAECPLPVGVLMRGEKPHSEARTTERIKQVAAQDKPRKAGRFVYLLVQQSPNKPAWRMKADDVITWQAVAVQGEDEIVLLAFSSLPKAVEFMQPAVVSNKLTKINKIVKYRWEVAQQWPQDFLLNPSDEILDTNPIARVQIDPALAEAPDE